MMCTCRPIDHAFDDDIDQYEIATRPSTTGRPVSRWSDESMREYAEYMKAADNAAQQEDANRALLRAEVTQATYAIPPKEATERELLAYLAADKDEQEDQ